MGADGAYFCEACWGESLASHGMRRPLRGFPRPPRLAVWSRSGPGLVRVARESISGNLLIE
jgi:hypothetical protein